MSIEVTTAYEGPGDLMKHIAEYSELLEAGRLILVVKILSSLQAQIDEPKEKDE
jgi:hypothetical protein